MKYVQRGNEALRVEDDAAASYVENGYDLLDDKGKNVVKKGKKASYTAAEYGALREENEKLKKEIAALKKS